MRVREVAAALSVVIAISVFVAPEAHADDMALNGRFLATSNGDWAMTNDVYRDEASVRSIWTIAMTLRQRPHVQRNRRQRHRLDRRNHHDQRRIRRQARAAELGAAAPTAAEEPSPAISGTASFPLGDGGAQLPGLAGVRRIRQDVGESGGCSLNDKLEIELPFRLEKLD